VGVPLSPSVQSPKAYDTQNLTAAKLGVRLAAGASATLRGNLVTALQDGGYRYNIHPLETAGGLVDANLFFGFEPGDIRRYKADPTGATDSSTAFTNGSAAFNTLFVPHGTYLVSNNATCSAALIFSGGLVKVAQGKTLTITQAIQAPPVQIFDTTTLGGFVALGIRGGEVWAEWWGAVGDLVKTNNEVPINQAVLAISQPYGTVGGTYGGTVRLARGDFYATDFIYLPDNVSLRGDGFFYSLLLAHSTFNATTTQMILAQNATAVQFTAQVAAAATSATLTSNWTFATGAYTVALYESVGGKIETRSITLTNGATTATWAGGLAAACNANAVGFSTLAMFNSRVEYMRLRPAKLANLRAIYAPAWQEKCGTDNVYIDQCATHGIYLDTGYGGATQLKIRRTEVFLDFGCAAGSYGIYINLTTYVSGWMSVMLEEIQVASTYGALTATGAITAATTCTLTAAIPNGVYNFNFSDGSFRQVTVTTGTTCNWTGAVTATAAISALTPNANGISGNGRVILNALDVHFEQIQGGGFVLQGVCRLTGMSIKADGNSTVNSLIQCSGGWTGTVDAHCVMRGGAINFITDNSRGPYALANFPGTTNNGGTGAGNYNDHILWPPDPAIPVCAFLAPGGAANAALSYQTGTFVSGGATAQTHVAAGQYRFNLNVSMDGVALYDVIATSDQGQIQVVKNSATQFDVFTRNNAGALTDSGPISVKVYHSP